MANSIPHDGTNWLMLWVKDLTSARFRVIKTFRYYANGRLIETIKHQRTKQL